MPGPPFPYRIVTPRLVVRCYEPRDALLVKTAIDASLDHLRPFMPWAEKEPQPLEEKVTLMRRFRAMFDLDQDHIYGIFDAGETELVGGTGLHPRVGDGAREIGYWVAAAHVRKGIAAEATSALVKAAIELSGLQRVEIHCSDRNTASSAVPRKLGFTLDATLRGRIPPGGHTPENSQVWSLFAEEYPATPPAKLPITAYDATGQRIG